MKASERAKGLNLVDYVLTIHDKTADGESCMVTGGFSALGIQAVIDAIQAAEKEAFEKGVLMGRLWEEGSLDGEYEIAKIPTYEDWRASRED